MRSQPTAGQATLEYLAAIALLAALFLFAGPAVGAPGIARSVADALKHGLCVVGGDICTSGDARRTGLSPCPLRSALTGHEASATAFSIEVGERWTLTVTPQSDGSVAVVRSAGVSAGFTGGPVAGATLGPVKFEAGAEGTMRARIQGARGWIFPNQATAREFLQHSVKHAIDEQRWPAAWWSGELGAEGTGSTGAGAGVDDQRVDLGRLDVSGQGAIGYRRHRNGSTTHYMRWAVEGPEVNLPGIPSPLDLGKAQWIAEYTRGPDGEPREFVLRTATSGPLGKKVTEVAARLDVRDPANFEFVRPAIDSWSTPRAGPLGSIRQVILDRIATHGTVETTVSQVDDSSRGGSIDVKLGLKFGLGGKQLDVHRTLIGATIQRGALVGKRLDCLPAAG